MRDFFYKRLIANVIRCIVSLLLLVILCIAIVRSYAGIKASIIACKIARVNMLVPDSIHNLIDVSEGKDKVNKKEFMDYIAYYHQLQKLDSTRAETYGILGFCYYWLGRKKGAEDNFLRAIELNPNFFWYYYNLGIIYFQQGKYESAVKMFDRALTLSPGLSLMYIRSPKTLHRSILKTDKNFALGIEHRLYQARCKAELLRIASYYYLGEYKHTVILAQRYISLNKCNDKDCCLCFLGMALYELGAYGKAIYFLKQSFKEGGYAEGYEYYSRIISRFGANKDPAIWNNIVHLLIKEGKTLNNKLSTIRVRLF